MKYKITDMHFANQNYFGTLICVLVICSAGKNTATDQTASFTPVELKCEYGTDPLGIDTHTPRLSWILQPANSGDRNLVQTAYQVLVASSPDLLKQDRGDLWNSGKVSSFEMDRVRYSGKALKSHQGVWWKVRTWDQEGKASVWSAFNQWTMGVLQQQDWLSAKWLGASNGLDTGVNSTFLLRREFVVKPGLKRAIISICGLGQYEITLNGKQLTETLLNPGWTQYDKTCLYDTYDITNLLNNGQNAAGVLVSNGMYRVKKGGRYAKFENSFGRLQAIAKIQFDYIDGSIETLVTDDEWKAGESPMTWSGIYGGEDWDARKIQTGWDKAGFDESKWFGVEILDGPGGALKGVTHAAPPIRTFQTFRPVSSHQVKPNTVIYDLRQDAAYVSRMTVTGPAGSVVKITPTELLNPDSTIFRNNYNARSYVQYTLAGAGRESYTSKFYTTSCRYYQVECIAAPGSNEVPKVESIEAVVVHSDNPYTGDFSCSNELFNRIFTMIKWAEVSNMKSVISDNPHRERLGWLEQTHLHGPSFHYNFNMRPLVRKIIYDMNDTQLKSGLVPCIAPELTVFGADWREAIEWGTASIMLPWQQYEWTGDMEILRQNYAMMKRYLDFLAGKAKDGIYAAEGKGDWAGRRTSPHTPKELVGTAFYYNNANVLAKTARLIGKTEEANQHEKLAVTIGLAFNKRFFNTQTKQYGTGSQAANAMALVLGLVDENNRKAVLENLVADIENRKYENTTGEVGMRYMLRALADGGRSDVVYKMNNQNEQPGYGYQLKMGATALPETWDAWRDNSQNQFMLGHIVEWFYHDLAGIQLNHSQPGFKDFVISPGVVGDLTEVKASYVSGNGKIVSEWNRNGKELTVLVVVPPNTGATVYIPARTAFAVKESGKPVTQIAGGTFFGMQGSYVVVKVGSGSYRFDSVMP